jgi:hypothetical protein
MEYEFTRLRIPKTANNLRVRRHSVVTGVTVSAGITKARVRIMVVFRAGWVECIHQEFSTISTGPGAQKKQRGSAFALD